jgi:hypothetical protein
MRQNAIVREVFSSLMCWYKEVANKHEECCLLHIRPCVYGTSKWYFVTQQFVI